MSHELDDSYYDALGGGPTAPIPNDAAADLTAAIAAHTSRTDNPHATTKAQVGLGNADNTADEDKPVSGPQASAIADHAERTDNPHATTKAQVGLAAVTNDAQVKRNEMGQALGVATLDASAKIPTAQLPDSVLGSLKYQGGWNATTNTPAIPAAAPANNGFYRIVTTAGTTNIDGTNSWSVGDWIVSDGDSWEKIVNTNAVASVQGRTGAVVLVKGDLALGNVDNTADAYKPLSAVHQAQLEENRLLRVAKVEWSNLAGGATMVLANLSGGPGNAESIQLSLHAEGSATEVTKLLYSSLLRITVDGAVAVEADLGTFMLTHGTTDAANSWVTDEIAVTMADPYNRNVTGFRRLLIPFDSTLLVELVSGSTTATALVFSQVNYRKGALPFLVTGTRKKKLLAAYTPITTQVAAYGTIDLLNVTGRGQVEGIHVFISGANRDIPSWLEGDPVFVIDGVTTAYGGTEDFFGTTFYGVATTGKVSDSWGIPQSGPIQAIAGWGTGMFRLFRKDPIVFDSSCIFRMGNGSAGQGIAPPTISIAALVFYHLDS